MIKTAIDLKHYCPETLSHSLERKFSLVCWNVYKKLHRQNQIDFLYKVLLEYSPELLLFQESPSIHRLHQSTSVLKGYEKYYFSNLEFKNRSFGLLTASLAESKQNHYVISKAKEFIFRTHKAFLVSLYPLESNKALMVINVHAINFRRIKAYQEELKQLYEFAKSHLGPLIIAGDFNSWGIKRLIFLDQLIAELELKSVKFNNARLIKSFLSSPLDHILYRDLDVIDASVLDCQRLSDHNPLYANFSIKN